MRAALAGPPRGGDVAPLRVGREEEDVRVAAGREADGVRGVRLDLPADQVAHGDAARRAVDDDQVEHLGARVQPHRAGADLAHQRLVGAEQQLLAGLAAGVEGARDLRAAEGAVVEVAGVVARERHPLRDRLVDDRVADLREPVDVRLAGAEVAALDGVAEEPQDAVAVVRVVLGGVDPALRRDAVGAARGILEAEGLDLVAELAEAGGGRGAREPGADDDHAVLALVRRAHEPQLLAAAVPLPLDRAGGRLAVEGHQRAPENSIVSRVGCGVLSLRTSIGLAPLRRWRPPLRATPSPLRSNIPIATGPVRRGCRPGWRRTPRRRAAPARPRPARARGRSAAR